VEYGFAHPSEANAYIRAHSQEMSEEVCAAHIKLYVNSFSLDLGSEGEAAVTTLLSRAEAAGLVPLTPEDIFLP
jgi:1,4-dihydroxy-6-naphthoate synthase